MLCFKWASGCPWVWHIWVIEWACSTAELQSRACRLSVIFITWQRTWPSDHAFHCLWVQNQAWLCQTSRHDLYWPNMTMTWLTVHVRALTLIKGHAWSVLTPKQRSVEYNRVIFSVICIYRSWFRWTLDNAVASLHFKGALFKLFGYASWNVAGFSQYFYCFYELDLISLSSLCFPVWVVSLTSFLVQMKVNVTFGVK